MRKKWNVIDANCLPTRLPYLSTAVAWLLLDRLDAPQWVWGAVGFFYLLLWAVAVTLKFKESVKPLPGFGATEQ